MPQSGSALKVSVVIPTRDRPESVKRLMESISETGGVHEVIIVDDCSDPPFTLGQHRSFRGQFRLIRSDVPLFLAAARNLGASTAMGDVVFFVDDDCVLARGTAQLLAAAFESDPYVGIAGPVIAYLNEPLTIWCAGVARGKWSGRTYFRGQGEELSAACRLPRVSQDFPSAFAVRRTCFFEVGGFDDIRFPAHMTEAELAERVRSLGYSCELVAEAVVWHDIECSDSVVKQLTLRSPEWAFAIGRDRMRFLKRYAPPRLRSVHIVVWLVILLPAHVIAALVDSTRTFLERLKVARSLLSGVFDGLVH